MKNVKVSEEEQLSAQNAPKAVKVKGQKFIKTQVTPVEPYDPEALIEVQHLTKTFGELKVLNNISNKIFTGEKVAVIGPSGSGKSTFLRCLNVLEDQIGRAHV